MAKAAKKKTTRGRKQDRARVAGGQKYEVGYEAKKTGRSASAVKKAVKKVGNARKKVEKRLGSLTSTEPTCRCLAIRACSDPAGEAGEGGQRLQARLDVAQVDLRLQEREFVVDGGLADVDVPGLGAPIRAVAPAVAAPFQRILQLERRLLRPDPDRLPACRIKQEGERRRSGRRQIEVQDLEQRVAVVDSPVRLVEEAGPVQQVAELRYPRNRALRQSTSVMLQPQAIRSKIGQYRSANFLSKPRCARSRSLRRRRRPSTAASSILWPATISSVMPVSAVLLRAGSGSTAR